MRLNYRYIDVYLSLIELKYRTPANSLEDKLQIVAAMQKELL